MPACICVDYLAHEWDTNDIIQANQEIKKQLKQIKKKRLCLKDDEKERKALQIEHDRLIRFQNALWRQMTKLCTTHLGRSNKMIHPSTVNWQKESDITWLYGPLYTNKPSPLSSQQILPPTPPPEGIKPVLKRNKPQSISSASSNDAFYRPWSKSLSESGNSSSSVRFNPDIEKLEYLPESPVKETRIKMGSSSYFCELNEEDDEDDEIGQVNYSYWMEENEDEEDDVLWSMILHLFYFISKKSSNYIQSIYKKHQHTTKIKTSSTTNNIISSSHHESPSELFFLFFNMTKSLTSLFATWIMYQSLLPFIWLINHSKKKHRHSSF
ncbi:hypothetical protein BJ944DRAFT_267462 [Cunninghamella echinulata]|nr:hypothetical protein BJ944DRAFT_267462 [Cunninghamella echinulata]